MDRERLKVLLAGLVMGMFFLLMALTLDLLRRVERLERRALDAPPATNQPAEHLQP